MSGTAEKIDLQKKYTEEERDAMFVAYAEACGRGDEEEASRIIKSIPVNPHGAKCIVETMGKDFLLEFFNITYANEILGEDWLNDNA